MARHRFLEGAPARAGEILTVFSLFFIHDLVRLQFLGNHQRQTGIPDEAIRVWLIQIVAALLAGLLAEAVLEGIRATGRFRGKEPAAGSRVPRALWFGALIGFMAGLEGLHLYQGAARSVVLGLIALVSVSWILWRIRFRFRLAYLGATQILIGIILVVSRNPGGDPAMPVPGTDGRDRPDIFLIVVDTVRSDRLGCYGYGRDTTPFLDRIAAESSLFERAYSGTPTTTPSTAAILGGPFPFLTGFPENRMRPENLTLAGELARKGYRTAGFSANPFVSASMGFDRGFSIFRNLRFAEKDFALTHLLWVAGERLGLRFPDRLRGRLLNRLVEQWLCSVDRNHPFFVYLHYMDPHYPYTPEREFQDRFLEPGAPVHRRFRPGTVYGQLPDVMGSPLPEPVRDSMSRLYDAEIAQWDHALGELWELLREDGWLADALVIVTSDHGEAFGEHGVWLHGNSLYNEVLRVPLLVHRTWDPGGERVSDPVSNTRIPVMILDLLARPIEERNAFDPAAVLGASGDRVVAQYSYGGGDYRGSALIGRDRKSMLLARGDREERRCFDLASDPGELRDLAPAEPDCLPPGLVSLLPAPPSASPEPLPPGTEDLLRSLGYVQ